MDKERLIRRIVSYPVMILGVAALFWGHGQYKKSQDAQHWPTVNGTVVSSAVNDSRSGSGHQTTYSPDVRYHYEVNGRAYQSHRVSFGDYADSDHSVARNIVDRYRPGQAVLVYYNPADPQVSVLEPGVIGGIWIPLLVGIGCVLVGLAGAIS